MLISVPRARIIVALAVVALACAIMLRKSGVAAVAVSIFSASLAVLLMITTPNKMRIRSPGQPFEWRKDF